MPPVYDMTTPDAIARAVGGGEVDVPAPPKPLAYAENGRGWRFDVLDDDHWWLTSIRPSYAWTVLAAPVRVPPEVEARLQAELVAAGG